MEICSAFPCVYLSVKACHPANTNYIYQKKYFSFVFNPEVFANWGLKSANKKSWYPTACVKKPPKILQQQQQQQK